MSKKVFIFNYKKHKNNNLKVEDLDNAFASIFTPTTSRTAAIISAIKIIIFFAYLAARKHLIEEQEKIERQEYEIERQKEISDVLNNDNLD